LTALATKAPSFTFSAGYNVPEVFFMEALVSDCAK